MNRRGQAVTEMVFVIPLLMMVISGGLFMAYGAWQGLRTQQAANLAARIQGQERVAGGTDQGSIEKENGMDGDPDPTAAGNDTDEKFTGTPNQPGGDSVYSRLYTMVKQNFFPHNQGEVFIPKPVIGQNVDRVKIVRVLDVPKLPFLSGETMPKQIKIEATAWGGEDTYMYGLPRWGKSTTSNSEWRRMVGDNSGNHD